MGFNIEESKKYIIIIGSLIIITLILFVGVSVFNGSSSNNTTIKEYVSLDNEHTSTLGFTSQLPIINLDSTDVDRVNTIIESDYYRALSLEDAIFSYNYSLNNNYLSLVTYFVYVDDKNNNYPNVEIKTYNFYLDTGNLVSDKELLDHFSVTLDDISNTFRDQLNKYYEEELESMYFTKEECNYECFLNLRGVSSYDTDIKLYVMDNELKFFRNFKVYSQYGEEQFYRNEDFLFDIEK